MAISWPRLRTSTEWQRTADQYFVWLSTLMDHRGIAVQIDEVIIDQAERAHPGGRQVGQASRG